MARERDSDGLAIRIDDSDLCRVLRHIGKTRRQAVETLVADALWAWVNRDHEQEDIAALDAALDGLSAPWPVVRRRLQRARPSRRAG